MLWMRATHRHATKYSGRWSQTLGCDPSVNTGGTRVKRNVLTTLESECGTASEVARSTRTVSVSLSL